MQVSKWGNSLAIRLPAAVVEALELHEGDDIEIRFSGMRPGEKLFEELSTDSEEADKTRHPKIFVGRIDPTPLNVVSQGMLALARAVEQEGTEQLLTELRGIVPEYIGKPSPSEAPPAAVSDRDATPRATVDLRP